MATEGAMAITVVISPRAREMVEMVLQLESGSTVAQALAACGQSVASEANAAAGGGVGVWGKRVGLAHVLRDQDRVEIYRPLTVDPKVARRERFAGQGAKRAAGLFAKRRAGAKAGY